MNQASPLTFGPVTMPCTDCTQVGDAWECTMNCSGRERHDNRTAGRNVTEAARSIAAMDDERIRLFALRDPDIFRDVARALLVAHPELRAKTQSLLTQTCGRSGYEYFCDNDHTRALIRELRVIVDRSPPTARDPFTSDKPGIFHDHTCYRCRDGELPCPHKGRERNCDTLRARND